MSLAATVPLNPNTAVGGEGKVESRANEAMSFDDLDAADFDAEKGVRKKKEEKKEKSEKTESKVRENDSKDAENAKDAKKKPEPKKDEKKEASDTAPEKKEDEPVKKPKSKSHKFKHGEAEGEVSGDATFTIPVDGGKEDVPFQEMVNVYNGSKLYKKQLDVLNNEKRSFEKERGDLNKTVTDFVERVNKDAGSAWDWLAELNGKNPIEFKENMLRQQIKEILPLAKMSPEELESWINQKKLEWRERRVNSKEEDNKKSAESQAEADKRRDAQTRFDISDEDYQKNYELAKKQPALKGAEPSPEQVAYVQRWNMAADAVDAAAPHLVKHDKYVSIMHDLATIMLESPKMSRAQLETHLAKEFGDDGKENLRHASRKAKKNADYDAEEPGSRMQKQKPVKGYESFEDL